MTEGTPIDLEKMRSIGVISRRTRPSVVEGDSHPDSGLRFKATTDELGHTVTEHTEAGSGVSVRQDVHLRPEVARLRSSTTANSED